MANAVVTGSLLSVGLAGALCALAAQAAEGSHVVPGSRAASLEHCVAPTPFMRRNHMELILHQRDVTVHTGVRSPKYGLDDCVACHVSYTAEDKPVPVNAEDQFCDSCHEYAAVELTCFQCHATVPVPEPKTTASAESATGLARGTSSGSLALSGSVLRPETREEGNRP
ncbi:MAG: sulfur reduction protein DsrJ [Chromatiaceae bacterium]